MMNLLEVFSGTEDLVRLSSQSLLFEEGAAADFMYVIMKGEISLSLHGTIVGTGHSPAGRRDWRNGFAGIGPSKCDRKGYDRLRACND